MPAISSNSSRSRIVIAVSHYEAVCGTLPQDLQIICRALTQRGGLASPPPVLGEETQAQRLTFRRAAKHRKTGGGRHPPRGDRQEQESHLPCHRHPEENRRCDHKTREEKSRTA